MNPFNLLFGFSGRINRAKWWLAVLIYCVVSIVGTLIVLVSGSQEMQLALYIIVNISIFISTIAVGIKRLHDREKSGAWWLALYLVPWVLYYLGVGLLTAGFAESSPALRDIAALVLILWLGFFTWMFVDQGCLRGTVGPNQYGPDPLPAPYSPGAYPDQISPQRPIHRESS